jgi:hypothetical protein
MFIQMQQERLQMMGDWILLIWSASLSIRVLYNYHGRKDYGASIVLPAGKGSRGVPLAGTLLLNVRTNLWISTMTYQTHPMR